VGVTFSDGSSFSDGSTFAQSIEPEQEPHGVSTSGGTTFALTAAAPASLDDYGYASLSYTEVGEVSDLGEIPERIYDLISWRGVTSRGESKAKGGYTFPAQTIVVGYDPRDLGQKVLAQATFDDGLYTVRIAHPVLGAIYGRALVLGGRLAFGDTNTIVTRPVTLEYVDAMHVPVSEYPPNALTSPIDGRVLTSPIDGRILLRAA